MKKGIIEEKEKITQAEAKIELIYQNLCKQIYRTKSVSVYGDKMGICLFLYYHSQYKGQSFDFAESVLNYINDELQEREQQNYYSLLQYAEFGWLLQHLQSKNMIKEDIGSLLNDLDDDLLWLMKSLINQDKYELLYGGTNVANYFLSRYKFDKEKYAPFLEMYLQALNLKRVDINDSQIAWRCPDQTNSGLVYNLGLAHGLNALLMFFYKLRKEGYSSSLLDEFLEKLSSFILAQEQDPSLLKSHFSGATNEDRTYHAMSRMGWCYGDLTVAYPLLCVSQYIPDIREKSLNILYDTTKRTDFIDTQIQDDGLCHGTFGTAHIYNRLFSMTGDKRFKEAALFWYDEGLKRPYYDNFPAGIRRHAGNDEYSESYGLLEGVAGIGLALISAVSDISPDWDECLLLS